MYIYPSIFGPFSPHQIKDYQQRSDRHDPSRARSDPGIFDRLSEGIQSGQSRFRRHDGVGTVDAIRPQRTMLAIELALGWESASAGRWRGLDQQDKFSMDGKEGGSEGAQGVTTGLQIRMAKGV